MNIHEVTIKNIEKTNKNIADTLKNKRIDDTGKSGASLKINIITKGRYYQSIGVDYLEFLNRGSRPWSDPSKYKKLGYILSLSGWAERKAKGISPYAIAHKIAHEGTTIFKDRSKGIELEKEIKTLKNNLKQELPQGMRFEAVQLLNKYKKKYLKTRKI